MKIRLVESDTTNDAYNKFLASHPTFTNNTTDEIAADLGTGEILVIYKSGSKYRWKVRKHLDLQDSEKSTESFDSPEDALKNFIEVSGLVRQVDSRELFGRYSDLFMADIDQLPQID